jgi:hypothetical protein
MFLWLAAAAFASEPDPLTAFAVGSAAYFTTAVVHEVAGHGAGCALAGGDAIGFSSTFMVCDTAGMSPGGVRLGTFAGTGANLLVGSTMTTTLLAAPPNDPWTYHYLWAASTTQLFLAGSYMALGGAFGTGDFGVYASTVDASRVAGTRAALVVSGLAVVGATFPLSIVLAEPMLGDERSSRVRRKLVLGLVPYLGAGVGLMTATAALNRELGPGNGAASALVGYGLGTLYFGYVPLLIAGAPPPSSSGRPAPAMGRSAAWLVIGAASIVGAGVLGAGVGALDPAPLDNYLLQ